MNISLRNTNPSPIRHTILSTERSSVLSTQHAGLAGRLLCGVGWKRDGPKTTCGFFGVPQTLIFHFPFVPPPKKRERKRVRDKKAMRCEGAPVTVFQGRWCFRSTIRLLSPPVKLLGAITRSLRSNFPFVFYLLHFSSLFTCFVSHIVVLLVMFVV